MRDDFIALNAIAALVAGLIFGVDWFSFVAVFIAGVICFGYKKPKPWAAIALILVGFFTGKLLLGLWGVALLVLVIWPNKKKGKLGSKTKFSLTQHIYGVPGSHIGGANQFGETAAVGSTGEKILGDFLNSLASERDDMYVFHGLCFTPGRPGADVDHLVMIGKKVWLVDAKLWKTGYYSWASSGIVLRNNKPFTGSDVRMAKAVEKWFKYLGVSVSAIVCPVGGQAKVDNKRSPSNTILATTNQLANVFSCFSGEADSNIGQKIVAQLQ